MLTRRLLLAPLLSALTASASWAGGPWETWPDTWVATDALGRKLPAQADTGPPKSGKTVGIFYFLWLNGTEPVRDISKLLAENPAAPQWGPPGAFHFWGEPLFGYYRSDDPFVIRKHLQMLSDAGVDVLFFDVTNALTYDPAVEAVCREIAAMKAAGQRAPQVAFLANSHHESTVRRLYDQFYQPRRWKDHWFLWQDKPLLLAPTAGHADEVKAFFTWRRSWAWTRGHQWFGDGRDRWPWLDHTPQSPGWHESPDKPEQIVACFAEHPITPIGRSFHSGKQPPADQVRPAEGLYFAEQMERALKVDPPFLFITGWNEWIAQRFIDEKGTMSMGGKKLPPGGTYFVDLYSQEFSRDAEPMRGGHGDTAYLQMAAGIRRFKGTGTIEPCRPQPVGIDGKFADWLAPAPEYRDTLNDPVQRSHPGWIGQPPFTDSSGRNDLAVAKVTHNAEQVFFYARTRATLSDPAGAHWMHLLIDSDADAATGWLGYDFAVNNTAPAGGMTHIVRLTSEGKTVPVEAAVPALFADNEIELAVPRSAVGLPPGECAVHFKWTDHIPLGSTVDAFTLTGDAAPNDRFMFRAVLKP